MFRQLWRKKALVVFLAALLILFPSASVRPAQALSKTVFLSVGIEKAADGYTVSGATVVYKFSNTGETETKVVSADGVTVPAAFEKIAANMGREVSLAHCNMIVLGESLAAENTAEILKYFLEKFEANNNALLVWTDADVAKMLETSAATKTGSAGGLAETIAADNQENVFKRPLTLDIFYKNYAKGRDSFMSVISLEEDEIINTRQMAVFNKGVFVRIDNE